jgi:hypothetical protein
MRRAIFIATLCAVAAACGENRTHPGPTPPDPALDCLPDLDGRIDADELEPRTGVAVTYLVAGGAAVDLAGHVTASGRREWDFTAAASGERAVSVTAEPLGAQWFAGEFPAGQLAVPLDADATTYGVYRADGAALWLLGVASADGTPGTRTLLVYRPEIALVRFPLEDGASWTSTGEITGGTISGQPYAGSDTYEVRVDGAGQMLLPDLTFAQALRVRTRVTLAPSAGAPVTRRQTSFYFECFGEVARATSANGETNDDFTTAAELRRLSL